jgi:hypothetical protein
MKRTSPVPIWLTLVCLTASFGQVACRVDQPVPRYASIGFDEGVLDGWSHVLREYVDESGRVDFKALSKHPEPLERYVTWIAHNGPVLSGGSVETHAERVAFYLNTYNALAMYNVLESGFEPDQGYGFFRRSHMRVDGRFVSLHELEQDVIRRLGEERVHFALSRMDRSSPRLRREPYTAELIDDQLERAAVEFFNDPRHVKYDASRERVKLSWILDEYKKDFRRAAPSLIAYANRYRADPVPDGARVSYQRRDDRLNAQ